MIPLKPIIFLLSAFGVIVQVKLISPGPDAGNGYTFTMPKTLWSGRTETACLTLYGKNINSTAHVSVQITSKQANSTVTKKVFDAAHIECFEVAVPQTNDYEGNVHLQIEIQGEPVYKMSSVEKVGIAHNADLNFVQTDRNLYKPGDLVKIRILLYNNDLSVSSKLVIPVVKIRSPMNIVIAQWSNVTTELGLVQLEHQLSEETSLGSWTIELPNNNGASKIFEVKEYTLPRFDVKIDQPKKFYSKAESYNFTVCSKYTYGEPVKGTARSEIKLGYGQGSLIPQIKNLTNGCAEFFHRIDKKIYYFDLEVQIIEQGTDEKATKSNSIYRSYNSYSLDVSPNYFQPGIPYKGKVKLEGDFEDFPYESLRLCYSLAFGLSSISEYSRKRCKELPISDKKDAEFVIFPFRDNIHSIHINVQLGNDTNRDIVVNRWYSPSNSYIHISHNSSNTPLKCNTHYPFTVLYTVNNATTQNAPKEFYYLITSKGNIVKSGEVKHIAINAQPFKKENYKNSFYTKAQPNMTLNKFLLTVDIDQKMYSEAELLVYYIHQNGEVVSNSIKFDVEKCFANKVEAGWTESQKYPGEATSFNIKAANGSLCAVSAVDKSTDILSPGLNLNTELLLQGVTKPRLYLYNPSPRCKEPQDSTGYDYEDYDLDNQDKRYDNPPFQDTFEVIDDMQLLVITNLATITKPCVARQAWRRPHPSPVFASTPVSGGAGFALQDSSPIANRFEQATKSQSADMGVAVRSYFPETWLFDLVLLGDNGETELKRDIPHSITQWIGNTFCVSPTAGVGVAPTSYITSFKPFFVDLLAPYAIKRNEVSHLKVITFNYLNHTLPVKITVELNENLQLAGSPSTFSACLASGDSVTNTFKVTALVDGKQSITIKAEVDPSYAGKCESPDKITGSDVILKNILVHVEGFPFKETNASYVCLNEHSTEADKNILWNLALPANAVPNYSRINILLDADLMELTVQNVGSLLQIPTGCGEQIMATLAPNLYILRYLKALNNLTSEVQEKSNGFMKTGYERILRYRHGDGSFSVFGEGSTESSMFLTAFVLRVLAQSSKYVYIDEQVTDKAAEWIIHQQDNKGCFPPSLNLYEYDRKDDRDDIIIVTAYVLISLIESETKLPPTVVDKAKMCLSSDNSTNKYRMAIVSYALTLAGAPNEANKILERLLPEASREKGLIWWQDSFSTAKSVETTAYAILALIGSNNREYKAVANGAVGWLLTKRNSAGGFISTQDTVVALDALSRYALIYKTDNVNLTVTIKTNKDQYVYKFNDETAPKNKQLSLKEFSSSVNFNVEGTGCILVQNSLRYNMPQIKRSEELLLEMNAAPILKDNKCQFTNISLCVAYLIPNKQIDMAVLELTLPSGYRADGLSLNKLVTFDSAIKRFEEKEDKVILYYSKLGSNQVCASFLIYEQSLIENRTSSIVRVYDYYNPTLYTSTSYDVPSCPIVTNI